ncbi:MAG: hypothetical protein NWR72_03955 [Bacteroidia bacterium]|nr:hypothetical protein [Bacteroidia bacterium]
MRGFYFVAVALLLLLPACSPPDTFRTLTGSWKLWAFEIPSEGILETEPDYLARSITITCKDRGKKGKYTLSTVTNVIEGEYLLDESGNMEVLRSDGTLFGEPAWGDKFMEAWRKAERYEIQPGQLFIYYNDGKSRMRFEKR